MATSAQPRDKLGNRGGENNEMSLWEKLGSKRRYRVEEENRKENKKYGKNRQR